MAPASRVPATGSEVDATPGARVIPPRADSRCIAQDRCGPPARQIAPCGLYLLRQVETTRAHRLRHPTWTCEPSFALFRRDECVVHLDVHPDVGATVAGRFKEVGSARALRRAALDPNLRLPHRLRRPTIARPLGLDQSSTRLWCLLGPMQTGRTCGLMFSDQGLNAKPAILRHQSTHEDRSRRYRHRSQDLG